MDRTCVIVNLVVATSDINSLLEKYLNPSGPPWDLGFRLCRPYAITRSVVDTLGSVGGRGLPARLAQSHNIVRSLLRASHFACFARKFHARAAGMPQVSVEANDAFAKSGTRPRNVKAIQ